MIPGVFYRKYLKKRKKLYTGNICLWQVILQVTLIIIAPISREPPGSSCLGDVAGAKRDLDRHRALRNYATVS
jgi:hypothetical protein